jgi:hypothetical protein
MALSSSERRVAGLTAAVVVALGLFAVMRLSPPSQRSRLPAVPCGLESRLTAEQCQRMVDYLVAQGLKTGAIPTLTPQELRDATGVEMPADLLPCFLDYAQSALDERRATTARSSLPGRSPSLV